MKIAAFYSDSPFAGWVQAEGFADVLRRMGHEVVPIPCPPVSQVSREQAERINQPIDDCELVLVSGPEHLRKWIRTFYKNWDSLKMPKVGWYHESFVREDYSLDYKTFEGMFDFHFFPDKADAEKYKGEWLPLGVDTEMFNDDGTYCGDCRNGDGQRDPLWPGRDIEVGFIGLMYPKRARFVNELAPHLGDIKIAYRTSCQSERGLIPAIGVWDFDGLNVRRSMQLLAETYRRIKVFVTFPSLSNVLVAKVLESLACGCILVAPKQPVTLPGCFEYEGAYQCAEQIRAASLSAGK
jgi:glycosyltransferase involved in cell wall biosynthesis